MNSRKAVTYTLKATPKTVHFGFYYAGLKPVLTIHSGETVKIETTLAEATDDTEGPVKSEIKALAGEKRIAHQSLLTAAKIVAATIIDLFTDSNLLKTAKEEFEKRTKDIKWYSPRPKDRPAPKFKPLPKEHYKAVIDAFKK